MSLQANSMADTHIRSETIESSLQASQSWKSFIPFWRLY